MRLIYRLIGLVAVGIGLVLFAFFQVVARLTGGRG